jgi:hypothetical protein
MRRHPGDPVNGLRTWLLAGLTDRAMQHQGPYRQPPPEHGQHPWWQVMCLTGVDYFSTLGYQPGIAVLAAGVLSPIATLVLVAVTLAGALPVYRRVAVASPHGEGSLAMLEHLLPRWTGKLLVLAVLGFAATDFMITMTLSAADATAHAAENPYAPRVIHDHPVLATMALLALLAVVFLMGFNEAIAVAVALVAGYLLANVVVIAFSLADLAQHPEVLNNWRHLADARSSSPFALVGFALLVFPKLALGLSGFETGVVVMPQLRSAPGDAEDQPRGRIRGTHRLLTTAACIMSLLLVASSVVTTMLIPAKEFRPGGNANGRALAYLAHAELGRLFGTAYDLITIAILWFAGASAMAGLLNLVPRYLPRYGMAPNWARAIRPLVLVFTAIAFGVTAIFRASVDRQGGAYATGVLVLITSAAVAVAIAARRHGDRGAAAFAVIAAVFVYTTVVNMIERPEGVKIAACFILGILALSFASRAVRSFELRVADVEFDPLAWKFITDVDGPLHIIANEPDQRDRREYADKERQIRLAAHIPRKERVLFLEVTITDPSEFFTDVRIVGEERFGYRILRVSSANIANTIAAVLLAIRDRTGTIPHVYFNWTEGNPLVHLLRFLFLGQGEIAPVTREVLREAEPDPELRPIVHVA